MAGKNLQKHLAVTAVAMLVVSLTVFAKGTLVFISNVAVSGLTSTTVTISWVTALPADSQVAYGTTSSYGSLTALDSTLVLSHSQVLSGLTPNTMYHYEVRSKDSSGNLHLAGDFILTTPPNIIQGMISGESYSPGPGTLVTIVWTTNTPANSQVEWGATTNYGSLTTPDPSLVTSHSVTLSQLAPNTSYHARARSIAANGNLGLSNDLTFTTGSAVLTISSVSVLFDTNAAATVTWSTSIPGDSQVEYGTTTNYGNATNEAPTMVTSHQVTVNSLAPNTLYHYRVRSRDGEGNLIVSSDFNFQTANFSVFFPRLNLGASTYTGIAIANLDQNPAMLNFTAFNNAGNLIQGSNVTNPASTTFSAGQQFPAIDYMIFGTGISSLWNTGWAAVNSSSPKITGFFMAFDGALSMMDGALLPPSLLSSFIFPEFGELGYTKLSLSNPSSNNAPVTIDLVRSDGTTADEIQTTVPGLGTYAADLQSQIFPGVTIDPSSYVQVSSSMPLLPYEFFGNVSKDISVLAGQDTASGGSTTLFAPEYVVGGTWNSSLSIVNLDAAPASVTLTWFRDDGTRIGTGGVSIAANGKIYISGQTFFTGAPATPQITSGYVQVTSSGARLTGSVLLSDAINGVFSTSMPLVTTLQQSVVFSHVASDNTYFMGLSIVNPNATDATVQIQLYTGSGQLDQTLPLVIPAGQRVSRLLTEYFPSLVGQVRDSGYVKVTSNVGLASIAAFGTQNLSILCNIPAQPAP